ncbi:hypothetical protein [Nocardia sp. NPDC052112]|uniref:hypothetical protein n=1 Tax=Nocardia sp. NPDC052112 TaxID=3155646 RepID=UPI003436D91C
MMRNFHVPLLALFTVLGAAVVVPSPATAADFDSLAATPVVDTVCDTGAPTFDDIVTAATTALRTAVPGERVAAFDYQVADFRGTIAAARVHRDGLPVAPSAVNERTDQLRCTDPEGRHAAHVRRVAVLSAATPTAIPPE